jgi:branched-chain amino acid transport system substrate-binding protein
MISKRNAIGSILASVGFLCTSYVHAQSNEIKIATIGTMSGALKDAGIANRHGVSLAAAEINAQGGIDGKKIVLVHFDDKGDAENAKRMAQDVLKVPNLSAVIGLQSYDTAPDLLAVFAKAKLPVVITGVGADAQTLTFSENVFRTAIPDSILAARMVKEIQASQGGVSIVVENSAYGKSGLKHLKQALESVKITNTQVFELSQGNRQLSATIQQIRKVGGNVLLWMNAVDAAAFRIAVNNHGWKPTIVASSHVSQADYSSMVGPLVHGTHVAVGYSPAESDESARRFYRNYRRFTGEAILTYPTISASAFDATYLLGMAVLQASSSQPQQIIKNLKSLQEPFQGIVQAYQQPFSNGADAVVSEDSVRVEVLQAK